MSTTCAASVSVSTVGVEQIWWWGGGGCRDGPLTQQSLNPQAVQNVGNMDTPASRAKEAWMEPLQPTVRQGVAQLKDFITKLVDIEEKEGERSPRGRPPQRLQARVCSAPDWWPRPYPVLLWPRPQLPGLVCSIPVPPTSVPLSLHPQPLGHVCPAPCPMALPIAACAPRGPAHCLLLMFALPKAPLGLGLWGHILPSLPDPPELDLQRALSLQAPPVKEGPLFIHRTKGKGPLMSSFKKLHFSLTTEALSFAKTPTSKVGEEGGGPAGL